MGGSSSYAFTHSLCSYRQAVVYQPFAGGNIMLTHNDIIFLQDCLDDLRSYVASINNHFDREVKNDLAYNDFDSVEDVTDAKLRKHFSYLEGKLSAGARADRKIDRMDSILTNAIK
jgi:hypothetical protein